MMLTPVYGSGRGLGRLSRGQTGVVYLEKAAENVEYDKIQRDGGMGSPGACNAPEAGAVQQVGGEVQADGGMGFLFLWCLVRPWEHPSVKLGRMLYGPTAVANTGGAATPCFKP